MTRATYRVHGVIGCDRWQMTTRLQLRDLRVFEVFASSREHEYRDVGTGLRPITMCTKTTKIAMQTRAKP